MPTRSPRSLTRILLAATFALAATVGVAAPANAAPAVVTAGDGVWAPSHAEATRVIPLCKGPVAVAAWLKVNFSDHGRDIDAYIKRNSTVLTNLASGRSGPLITSVLLSQAVLQIPSYAVNDALFHLPATTLSLATGCGIIGATGTNPFSVLK